MKSFKELLQLLTMEENYSKIYQYYSIGLKIDTGCVDCWYWNILSLYKAGSVNIAKKQWEMDKTTMIPDNF